MDINFSSLEFNDWFFVLFDASKDALIVTDYEFNLIHANHAFCNLSDYSKEAIDQMNFNGFLSEEGTKALEQLWKIKKKYPKRTEFTLDLAFQFKNTSTITEIPVHFSLLSTNSENEQRMLLRIPPIEFSLQHIWQAYFEQSKDYIWVVDTNSTLVAFSQNSKEIFKKLEPQEGMDMKSMLEQKHKVNWINAIEESIKTGTTIHLSDTYKSGKKTQHTNIAFIPVSIKDKVTFCMLIFNNTTALTDKEHQLDKSNRDLTALTLRLTDKKNFIKELDKSLELLDLSEQEETQEELGRLRRQIAAELRKAEDADTFDLHFRKIHPDFFKKLSTKCPSLTQNELKHCAYIRMNLSNKEVSSLLHVMPRTIEIARYRIKKKLGLARKVRLKNFINSL